MAAPFVPDEDFIRISDICTALGVPDDDRVLFWRWADELPSGRAVDELNCYVDVLIAERCRRPADDELGRLVMADLTDDEIRRRIADVVAKPEARLSRCRPSRA
ncbi:hypothetical protein CRM90_09495 [Mycobacterium sp. ENV421]|uniref:hypothetical protein n=1 Tax=unclassified Mycobacterium TaxID=2642494 RepID=UPI000C99CF45|nr:hypothetical protein [Mycobacterium sp. ENV421]PND58196.1 hypothetical protein CRM90_09495 [Mycobacterium sp. ENV421]